MSEFQPRKYEEEPRWLSWLAVQRNAIFLLDPEEESEEELWSRAVARNGLDEETFAFADVIRARHALKSDHGYYSKSTVRMDIEPESQHDWAESETIGRPTLQVVLGGTSGCGKPESSCYDFSCKHTITVESAEVVPSIRNEWKVEWTSMADRPDEAFFLGLAGLRYVENNFERYTKWNKVCPECHIYTPKNLDTCQNCDKVLASK